MIIDIINKKLEDTETKKDTIKIWFIKEILQSEVLDFIYQNKSYKNIIFYGWTAIRFLLGLNRLSEDLDFLWQWFNDFEQLWRDLKEYFINQHKIKVDYKIQKFRITLKFRDFLQTFNLQYDNSNDLYLKIEISDHFDFCKNYKTKYYPIIYQNKSILIYSLDESTLFATKLNAVLYRQRAKNKNSTDIKVKWRDFYDLFRYLQKNIIPNVACIRDVKNMQDLKDKLSKVLENTNFKEVIQDIENFVEDDNMLEFIQDHWRSYILEQIKKR